MNESDALSCDVFKVPDNTYRKKQLQSKAKCNDENVPPQIMALPKPCRKKGRPKKSIENEKKESNLVNLISLNRSNFGFVPDKAYDITPNVLSYVSRFSRVRKAMRVLNEQ
jgi:hypothetical protein